MKYEATINGKYVVARTERRLQVGGRGNSFTPGFAIDVDGEPSGLLEISPHPHFDGNCIGGDACAAFIDEFLITLGFTMVPDPEPKTCPTCGAFQL